jgi:ABC-type phosphate/phosphonate transport system substrate-binding protein
MQDTLAERLAGEKQLRILFRSGFYPSSGIVAGPGLPAEAREKISRALLAFDPLGREKPRLYQWDRTEMPNGFVPASAGDYDELRHWLTRLDLLDVQPERPR